MFKDFSKFLMRGNVIDLAVGVIIGGAFSKIIDALVSKIIMPLIGIVLADGVNFGAAFATVDNVKIEYGAFVQAIIDFIIIGLVLYLILKAYDKSKKKEEAVAALTPPPAQETLLSDIKNLLTDIRSGQRL